MLPKLITFVFSLFIPTLLLSLPIDPNSADQLFLLTYPRSGTNLISCYLQAFTLKPIRRFATENMDFLAGNRLKLALNYDKKPLIRSHYGDDFEAFNHNNNKLIFLLRDYKEAIHRHSSCEHDNEKFLNLFFDQSKHLTHYIKNLETYHHWDKKKRLLIYYENLISQPVREVKRILKFIEEPIPKKLTTKYLNEISTQALESYHQQHLPTGGSTSKGMDPKFHSKQFLENTIKKIDEYMKTQYPELWNLYLKRFEGIKALE